MLDRKIALHTHRIEAAVRVAINHTRLLLWSTAVLPACLGIAVLLLVRRWWAIAHLTTGAILAAGVITLPLIALTTTAAMFHAR